MHAGHQDALSRQWVHYGHAFWPQFCQLSDGSWCKSHHLLGFAAFSDNMEEEWGTKGGDPEFLWDFEITYFFRHCLQGLLNYKRGETEVLMTHTWCLASSWMFALIPPLLPHPLSMRLRASVMVELQQYALKYILWISAQLLTGYGNPISQICRVSASAAHTGSIALVKWESKSKHCSLWPQILQEPHLCLHTA